MRFALPMKSGLSPKKEQSTSTNTDFADVVGYARCEFRDGRSEKEVLALLVKSGHKADTIRGVVRELYYECLGVSFLDRCEEMVAKIAGLPIALYLFLKVETTPVAGLSLLAALSVYVVVISVLFRRHWEKRHRRRLHDQQ